jgi:hypothetical protein
MLALCASDRFAFAPIAFSAWRHKAVVGPIGAGLQGKECGVERLKRVHLLAIEVKVKRRLLENVADFKEMSAAAVMVIE